MWVVLSLLAVLCIVDVVRGPWDHDSGAFMLHAAFVLTRNRVNSVLPGYLETGLSSGLSEEQKAQIRRRTPLRRLATCDDVAPLVRFLLSDGARFIIGQCIVVDGRITV